MAISELIIQSTLKLCIDPNTGKDFVSAKSIKNIQINGNDVSLDVVLGYPAQSQLESIRQQITDALKTIDGIANITINVGSRIVAHGVQRGVNLLPNVKNVIAVASGKGGVGKSTTSVNLALALAAEGATVGLLDADIYGPSQPQMLGISGRPDSADGKSIEPMRAHGIQAMSIGFLVDTDTPMVWRGPMVTGALEQLLRDTRWQDLDYLVIDLPPGTGDIQLTLAQKIPVTGLGIVALGWPPARRRRAAWLLAGAMLGWGLIGVRAVAYQASALAPGLQARDVQVVGRVASLPQLDEQSERFEFVIESAHQGGQALALPGRVQVSWWSLTPERRVMAGERWAFTVRLRPPRALFNQHGFDRELWWWQRGLLALAQVREGPSAAAPQRLGLTPWHPIEWVRQQWVQRIERRVPSAREAGVLAALAVGDQNAIAAGTLQTTPDPASPMKSLFRSNPFRQTTPGPGF